MLRILEVWFFGFGYIKDLNILFRFKLYIWLMNMLLVENIIEVWRG